MRIAIPYPCIGCSSSVFRISMSSVPCTNPLALSDMPALLVMEKPAPLDNPEEHRTRTLDCQEESSKRRPKGLGRAEARPYSGDVSRPRFSTRIHTFAQSSGQISIDAQICIHY